MDFKKVININIDTYEGNIPNGYDLVVYDKKNCPTEKSYILYGWDEIGEFEEDMENPQYAFLRWANQNQMKKYQ